MMIEANGRAKSEGGTSGNKINGISPWNPLRSIYMAAAKKRYGEAPDLRKDVK